MFYFSFERESVFEDSLNVIFVAMVFLWFFIVFFMAFLWKWFSYDLYDFLDVLVVGMIFMIFCYNPLWSLWFLWFLWSWTFYSFLFQIRPLCPNDSLLVLATIVTSHHRAAAECNQLQRILEWRGDGCMVYGQCIGISAQRRNVPSSFCIEWNN